jgi:hypothetical protein
VKTGVQNFLKSLDSRLRGNDRKGRFRAFYERINIPSFHYSGFSRLEAVMGQSGKKRYEKPKLKKVKLDAKCAVLGFCKTTGKIGPGRAACGVPVPKCFAAGS